MKINKTKHTSLLTLGLLGASLLAQPALAQEETIVMPEQVIEASPRTPMQINLNTASVDELVTLPGIGPSRADSIVRIRERRPFRRVEELVRVRGIGRKTMRRLRSRLTVGEVQRPQRARSRGRPSRRASRR